MNWEPITYFANGWEPHPDYPPEFTIHPTGDIELRGLCWKGKPGTPCARLPQYARPEKTASQGYWWGFENENYREWRVGSDGYVTIRQFNKYQLLDAYLGGDPV